MFTLKPSGLPNLQFGFQYSVDWSHPIASGLSYVNVLNNLFSTPTYTKFANGTLTNTTISTAMSPAGVGIRGVNSASRLNWVGSGPSVQSIGTVMCYATPGIGGAGANDFVFRLDNGSETISFLFFRPNGANWYVGFYTGVTLATCINSNFAIGVPTILGFTWNNPAAANAYYMWAGGQKAGSSNQGAGPQNTAGYNLCIGNSNTSNLSWWQQNPTIGAIHWLAFWDRILSDEELIYLNANPMCFLVPAEYEMPILNLPTAAFIPAWAAQSNLPVIGAGTY